MSGYQDSSGRQVPQKGANGAATQVAVRAESYKI